MTSTHLTFREIDELCSNFEDRWTPEIAGGQLRKFAQENSPSKELSSELFSELIQVDLEQRWRHLLDNLEDSTSSCMIDHLEIGKPKLADYFQDLPMQILSDEQLSAVTQCERKCLLKYGQINEASVLQIPEDWMAKHMSLLPRVTVRHIKPTTEFDFSFWSPLWIGRQAKGETAPTSLSRNPQQKLVIAKGRDDSISRQQLRISILIGRFAKIYNGSANRHCQIAEVGDLPPGEEMVVKLPVIISLESVFLSLDRRLARKPDSQ